MGASSEAAAGRVRELLERIADAAGVDATVEVRDADDGLHAEFVGEDLGLLIGHHGQTIDAIQHLAYRIAGHGPDPTTRACRCWSTPRGTANAVPSRCGPPPTRRPSRPSAGIAPVALDAMSALERKVIHEHLKDRHDVETYSEGQEPSRYLVVAPLVD